jgi:hypothetical protein
MHVPDRKINQINILKPFFGEQKAEKTTQITIVSDLLQKIITRVAQSGSGHQAPIQN